MYKVTHRKEKKIQIQVSREYFECNHKVIHYIIWWTKQKQK